MAKYRCPKFGCNGTGLPAGTKKAKNAGRYVIGDTPAYLSGRYSNSRLLSACGYNVFPAVIFCHGFGAAYRDLMHDSYMEDYNSDAFYQN